VTTSDAIKRGDEVLHRLGDERVHYRWDNSLEPLLEIESGDTVVFQTRDAADGFYTWDSTHADILRRAYTGHPLTGPVRIKGAQPGDSLEIEILDLKPGEIGRTSLPPGKGLLAEDFPEPFLKIWDLRNGSTARFRDGIEIPFEPFHGVMGVAPAEPGEHLTSPPRRVGGNLDVKQLTAGSVLYLPIEVEGALFSVGDGHAAQGDGEVCSSAIETSMTTTLRFTLRPDLHLVTPQFRTAGPLSPRTNTAGWYATTGVGPDLMAATKQATREMIAHLGRTYDLSPAEACVLCSVAMDLKISEIVDAPNWVVSAFIPLSIFRSERGG
jgi:acetamidase/formamidase